MSEESPDKELKFVSSLENYRYLEITGPPRTSVLKRGVKCKDPNCIVESKQEGGINDSD